MTRKDRKALISNLTILLIHLLKYKFQPKQRTKSWFLTIKEHRKRLNKALKNIPSLKKLLRRNIINCL